MTTNQKIALLTLVALVAYTGGLVSEVYTGFIFIALAPVLGVREYFTADSLWNRMRYIALIPIIIIVAHTAAALTFQTSLLSGSLLIYAVGSALPFVLLEIAEDTAPNKWGVLMLVVYWVAMEYFLLKIDEDTAYYFIANALPVQWVGWNSYTGFLGGSLFVVLGNCMFFHALFRADGVVVGRVRWISLVLSLIVVIGIALVGLRFDSNSIITVTQVVEAYQTHALAVANTSYHENGELIGRLCLWVTGMVVLYTFVKRKMKKK